MLDPKKKAKQLVNSFKLPFQSITMAKIQAKICVCEILKALTESQTQIKTVAVDEYNFYKKVTNEIELL